MSDKCHDGGVDSIPADTASIKSKNYESINDTPSTF